MSPLKSFAKESGVVAAATVGAGIFALPFVFLKAGWMTSIFYMVVLSAIVISVHALYFRALGAAKEKNRLLGLARDYLGKFGFWTGFFAIVGGLLLTLVIYLILGSQFIRFIAPHTPPWFATLLFWFVVALPLFLKERRDIVLGIIGIVFVAAIIFFIFFTSNPGGALSTVNDFNSANIFFPFGIVLFALAGWPAVEPVFDIEKRSKSEWTPAVQPYLALAAGTIIAAVLYLMFVLGILGSASLITTDTISGLANWPHYKIALLAVLGLFAIWDEYLLIGLEIKHSLQKDLGLSGKRSVIAIIALPPLFLLIGLNGFARVVGLVGGVFLSLQYLLMVAVSKKILPVSPLKRALLNALIAIFVLAAIYEVYYFVLK